MEKRYGKFTAISMVVGIVIGSGVFFKAVKVLSLTGGNMLQALMVIGIVGLICIVCSCTFASMGTKYSHCNGIIDYAEVAGGSKFAYFMGWFMASMYYPVIAATLAYISARYTCVLLGYEVFGMMNLAIGMMYLAIGTVINALAPKLAGKLQVSMTVIKLIPLLVMGIIGTIVGIQNGNGIKIFEGATEGLMTADTMTGIFGGVVAFAFSFEGWIVATTINQELENPKRDLPKALIGGALFCTIIYILYTYSMSANMTAAEILEAGDDLPMIAFSKMFGPVVGTIVMVFIIISCLGTMNGMVLCTMRGFYGLAARGMGPKAEVLGHVDSKTGMPLASCFVGFGFATFWLFQFAIFFFNGPLVFNTTGNPIWLLAWEADEIVIIVQYLLYIPIFIHMMIREKDFGFGKRFILPLLSTVASLFMAYCAYSAYGLELSLSFLATFAIFMIVGLCFMNEKNARKLE